MNHDNNVIAFLMTCKMPIKPLYYTQLLFVIVILIVIIDIAYMAEDVTYESSITISMRAYEQSMTSHSIKAISY